EEDRQRRAEVGLDEDQPGEDQDEKTERPCEFLQGAGRRAAREVSGCPDDDRELCQLRRLKDKRPDIDPPASPVDARTAGEDGEAEYERRHDQGRRELAEPLEWEARDDDEQRDSDRGVDDLLLDEAERICVPERGGTRGRAVHHDEPEENERRRDEPEQVPLELEPLRLHESSSTRRRNISPRSSKFANWS